MMQFPMNTVTCDFASPLGRIKVAAASGEVVGVWFADSDQLTPWTDCRTEPHNPVLQQVCEQLDQYFAGQRIAFDLPIRMNGTAFQNAVWQMLMTMAYGSTVSYGTIGRCIGKPKTARAVGAALRCNPCVIVVPCHRVIGAQGNLTGYAGGLARKTALLKLEAGLRVG